jgi:hypothetical protein
MPPSLPRSILGLLILGAFSARTEAADNLRPPAVPLVVHDPYFSIWSAADRLSDAQTTHWTGKAQPLTSLVYVDGFSYRLMGAAFADVQPLPQVGLEVLPTRTIYRFEGAEIGVTLTFMSPALPEDLDVLSRPLTYVSWEVRSADGREHTVQLAFGAGAELAVNTPDQAVTSSPGTSTRPQVTA